MSTDTTVIPNYKAGFMALQHYHGAFSHFQDKQPGLHCRGKNDPKNPPPRKPGDTYVVAAMRFAYLPPDESQMRGQADYLQEQRSKRPKRKPGDRYTEFGALMGTVLGLIIGIKTGMPLWIITGLIGGGIAGIVIGSFIGSVVVKLGKPKDDPPGH